MHFKILSSKWHFNGLEQERGNSIANTLELRLSCTNPSIYCVPLWKSPIIPLILLHLTCCEAGHQQLQQDRPVRRRTHWRWSFSYWEDSVDHSAWLQGTGRKLREKALCTARVADTGIDCRHRGWRVRYPMNGIKQQTFFFSIELGQHWIR